MYRVLASEPELQMLEEIENMYEPTSYEYKAGCFVDYITPEICKHIQIIYNEKILQNDSGGEIRQENRPTARQNSVSSGRGEPYAKRIKRESR